MLQTLPPILWQTGIASSEPFAVLGLAATDVSSWCCVVPRLGRLEKTGFQVSPRADPTGGSVADSSSSVITWPSPPFKFGV